MNPWKDMLKLGLEGGDLARTGGWDGAWGGWEGGEGGVDIQ